MQDEFLHKSTSPWLRSSIDLNHRLDRCNSNLIGLIRIGFSHGNIGVRGRIRLLKGNDRPVESQVARLSQDERDQEIGTSRMACDWDAEIHPCGHHESSIEYLTD